MRDLIRSTIRSLKDSVDYLEVRIEQTDKCSMSLKGREIDSVSQANELGCCVRALHNGGWGFASFNNLDEIQDYARFAIDEAKRVGKTKSQLAPVEAVEDEVKVEPKKDPRGISLDDKLSLMQSYNKLIMGHDSRITSSSLRYFDRFHKIWFGNSDGTNILQEKLDIGGICAAIAAGDNTTQSQWVPFGSSDDYSVAEGLDERVMKCCDEALQQLQAPKVKGGRYTVIADPQLSGVFVHEAFGHLSEADHVCENDKLLGIMALGKKFGREILNIYDTGRTSGARGYLKYDDEGVPTEKTWLVRKGELTGRLHTRETAAKMDERPTGNSRAITYRFPPICRMRDTRIDNGTMPLADMMSGIDQGLYVVGSKGGQTAIELFTFAAGKAYMIRNGSIGEMVRDVTLSGNLFKTLENIDAIGNDERHQDGPGGCGRDSQFPLPVSMGAPHIRILDCVIGGE